MPAKILQRGTREAGIDGADQLHETPESAVKALLQHEALPPRLWEPAAGRGAIARLLRQHGHTVIATDIRAWPGAHRMVKPGFDFLAQRRAPKRCGAIVTNPPFKLADDFIRHGLTLVPRVVVLLRLAALEGVRRGDLMDGHLVRLWVGKERLPMMHREGWQGNKASQPTPYAWFVFERQATLFGFEGRRISWRQE
jgi:hypothetical protein